MKEIKNNIDIKMKKSKQKNKMSIKIGCINSNLVDFLTASIRY